MKISVYGSAAGNSEDSINDLAKETGRQIASRGHILITGACTGIPYEAVLGASEFNGNVIGFSPALNEQDHSERFNFPNRGFSEIKFISGDFKYKDNKAACCKHRNVCSVAESDAVVIISGRCGTLNEFTIAYDTGKNIGVLTGTGGITDFIPKLIASFNKPTASKIIYEQNPEELIKKLEELHAQQLKP